MRHKSANKRVFAFVALLLATGGDRSAGADFTLVPEGHPVKVVTLKPDRSQGSKNSRRMRAFPVVQGFGKDIPLAFAIRQIVPRGVLVIASSSVSTPYVFVSWRGGVPWNVALQAALKPAGLTAHITPVSVTIEIASTP